VKKWIRQGPAAPDFEAEDVLPRLTAKAIEQVKQAAKEPKPFFLYLALNSPHTPILPTAAWRGKSGLGPYGDFVMQTDTCVGEVLAALDQADLAKNTLVIFTSDNGCSPAADIPSLEAQGHYPMAHLRGTKADIWDGGHRVPFFVRWPEKVKAGSRCETTICLTDFMATAADIIGAPLPETAAVDSFTFLPDLLGTGKSARTNTVHHSIHGQFAIREGNWKLAFCPGSGGWSKPGDPEARKAGLPEVQLYNMAKDPGEKQNLATAQPDVVQRLTAVVEKVVSEGRSTPGPAQKNDRAVDYRKARP
jgi:arylsulfatase A-like enzyme